jgi:hypothetical protein
VSQDGESGELSNGLNVLANGIAAHEERHQETNGHLNGLQTEDGDMADAEGDEGLDDDMLDKISSSPSIDDGRYHLPLQWPARRDSLDPALMFPIAMMSGIPDLDSSSPYVTTPDCFPSRGLLGTSGTGQPDCLGPNGAAEPDSPAGSVESSQAESFDDERLDVVAPPATEEMSDLFHPDRDLDEPRIRELLLPAHDPLLEAAIVTSRHVEGTPRAWPCTDPGEEAMECSDEEPDTAEVSCSEDPRLVDSGWGGECLREIEDIDFEFVYALHTFVATVEGQANATKGDTMVLLDDSNSYWWLVRVVKDSSIGRSNSRHR